MMTLTSDFSSLTFPASIFGSIACIVSSGAILLNVIKEELPWVDEVRFTAFVAGAVAYTAVLLVV